MVVVVDRQATLPPAAASWPATASPAALPAPTGDADGLRDGGYGRFRDASGVAACAAIAGTAACAASTVEGVGQSTIAAASACSSPKCLSPPAGCSAAAGASSRAVLVHAARSTARFCLRRSLRLSSPSDLFFVDFVGRDFSSPHGNFSQRSASRAADKLAAQNLLACHVSPARARSKSASTTCSVVKSDKVAIAAAVGVGAALRRALTAT